MRNCVGQWCVWDNTHNRNAWPRFAPANHVLATKTRPNSVVLHLDYTKILWCYQLNVNTLRPMGHFLVPWVFKLFFNSRCNKLSVGSPVFAQILEKLKFSHFQITFFLYVDFSYFFRQSKACQIENFQKFSKPGLVCSDTRVFGTQISVFWCVLGTRFLGAEHKKIIHMLLSNVCKI